MKAKSLIRLARTAGGRRLRIAAEEAAALARFLLLDLRVPERKITEYEIEAVVGNYQPPEDMVLMTDGSLIYGEDGRVWLDLQGAYSANNAGNCNPRVTGANHLASSLTSVLSRARRNRQLALAARELQLALGTDYRLLPMNSGCEAIEGAVLLAKLAFNRHPKFAWKRDALREAGMPLKVVACRNNFHGRSSWAKAVSTNPAYRDPFAPNTLESEIRWVDFGDIGGLEKAFEDGDVSVFVAEPIQCEGGMNMPPADYFRRARELCDLYDILMVLDEVQTGLGRTGRMLAQQHYFNGEIKADFISLAKSLSGGQEVVSAILCRPDYAELIRPSEHGSTFGGSPKACATMRAAVREIQDRWLCKQAELKGKFCLEVLKDICAGVPNIVEARGLGLAIGIEVDGHGADDICARLRDTPFTWRGRRIDGAWTNATHGITDSTTVVRISPPLNVPIDLLAATMPAIAKAVGHKNPEMFRVLSFEEPAPVSDALTSLHLEAAYLGRRARRFLAALLGSAVS